MMLKSINIENGEIEGLSDNVFKSKTSCFTVEGGIYFTRLDVIFEGKTTCFTFRGDVKIIEVTYITN